MVVEEFRLPDLGEGVAEGELVRWLVEPGDRVEEDEPVAEVETDKAMVEVPSPYDGTIEELRAEEGEIIPVGTVIVTYDVDDDAASGSDAAEPADATDGAAEEDESGPSPPAPPSVRRLARELGVDLDDVAGSGPSGRPTEADVRAAAEGGDDGEGPREVDLGGTPAAVPKGDDGRADAGAATDAGGATGEADRDHTLATPATRRVAEELGVDIDAVPTDETRDGEPYVSEERVRAYASSGGAESSDAADAATAPATGGPSPDGRATDIDEGPTAGERVPYRGVRRSIGEQMERSKYTAPHVTHHDDVAVDRLVEVREELNAVTDAPVTYLPFVMKAAVAGLKQYPYVNARLDEEAEEIVCHDAYNVGVATATDAGLMVPVVEDVDRKGIEEIAREVADLTERARDRTIERSEMQGGTFTVTNVGVIGGEYATPIVNYPEVAILAMGAIRQRPRVVDGEVTARYTLPVSLSVDHRVVDGAVAARFTNHVLERLAEPARLLL